MVRTVDLTSRAERGLKRAPHHVARKLLAWVESVEEDGIEVVRRSPGFHDEPLKGTRAGQRSIRLSRSWRAIYRIAGTGALALARIEEVTKHGY